MSNLLNETLRVLQEMGSTPADIVYIGSNPYNAPPYYTCDWETFKVLADRDYDNGYGGAEVATDLVILLANGNWLERSEYDGSEWWRFVVIPRPPDPAAPHLPVKRLIGSSWPTLSELHNPEEREYKW